MITTIDKSKGLNKAYSKPFSRIKKSINAENVARKVLAKIEKGEKVSVGKIMREVGYSKGFSVQPSRVVSTFSYQATIAPYIQRLVTLRDKTALAISSKDLDNEKLYDLTTLMKNINHDLQLLQGKSTENIANKTEVVVYGSDDFLAKQMRAKESSV